MRDSLSQARECTFAIINHSWASVPLRASWTRLALKSATKSVPLLRWAAVIANPIDLVLNHPDPPMVQIFIQPLPESKILILPLRAINFFALHALSQFKCQRSYCCCSSKHKVFSTIFSAFFLSFFCCSSRCQFFLFFFFYYFFDFFFYFLFCSHSSYISSRFHLLS